MAGPQTGLKLKIVLRAGPGRAGKRNYGQGRDEKYSHFTISNGNYLAAFELLIFVISHQQQRRYQIFTPINYLCDCLGFVKRSQYHVQVRCINDTTDYRTDMYTVIN